MTPINTQTPASQRTPASQQTPVSQQTRTDARSRNFRRTARSHVSAVARVLLLLCLIGVWAPAALAQGVSDDASPSATDPFGNPIAPGTGKTFGIPKVDNNSVRVEAATDKTSYAPGESGMLAVLVRFPDGMHAQSHTPLDKDLIAFDAAVSASDGVTTDFPRFAPPQLEDYPNVGKLSVYTHQTIVHIPFTVAKDASGSVAVTGSVTYQICNDQGQCLQPDEAKFDAKVMIAAAGGGGGGGGGGKANRPELFKNVPPAAQKTDSSGGGLDDGSRGGSDDAPGGGFTFFQAFYTAIFVGLLFNLMPCVLPVLPLKVAGFYEVSQHNRSRTLLFGGVFSIGILAVFGVLATLLLLSKSLFGFNFQWGQQFANPWFVWPLVAVLVGLGFWMLGLFNVNLPSSVYGLNFRHDTLGGNFMWGSLTAVLSTPCTAPLLTPVLGYALLQSVAIGYVVILSVGVGMALPYLILSGVPEVARKLPRTGPLSELIKQGLSFFLLATAAFFIGLQLVDDPRQFWFIVPVMVWGGLFIVVRGMQLFKGSGAMLVTTAVATLFAGGSVLLALQMNHATGGVELDWTPYTDAAFADARKGDKQVLVKFTAGWCANCKYIEQTVYTDPRAIDAIHDRGVIALKADLTHRDAAGWKLLDTLGQTGIPFTAIYAPGSDRPSTLSSVYTTAGLLETLKKAG